MVRDATRGAALPLILFILMALLVLAHGALVLSRQERITTRAFLNTLLAGRAAEAAVRVGLGVSNFPWAERSIWLAHPLVSGKTDDGLRYRAVARWLDGEFFLLEGTGGARGWEGERRTGLVGWSLLPSARIRGFGAGLEMVGSLRSEGQGRLDMGRFFDPPEGWRESDCSLHRVALDSLFPGGAMDPTGPLSQPLIPPEVVPPLGLLSGSRLLELAASGSVQAPHPLPGDSVRGCPEAGGPEFFGGRGSVSLTEGRVCGVLVVEGDLLLAGRARFQGLALVGGDLVVEDSAVFEGLARVGGGTRLSDGGLILGSGCPVFRALSGIPSLQTPYLVDGTPINGF